MEISPIKYANLKQIPILYKSNDGSKLFFEFSFSESRKHINKKIYFIFDSIVYSGYYGYDKSIDKHYIYSITNFSSLISSLVLNDELNIFDTFSITEANEVMTAQDVFDYFKSIGAEYLLHLNKINPTYSATSKDGLLDIFEKTKLSQYPLMMKSDNTTLTTSWSDLLFLKTNLSTGTRNQQKFSVRLVNINSAELLDFELSFFNYENYLDSILIKMFHCSLIDLIEFRFSNVVSNDVQYCRIETRQVTAAQTYNLFVGLPINEDLKTYNNVGFINSELIYQFDGNNTIILDSSIVSATTQKTIRAEASLTENVPFDVSIGLFSAGQYMNSGTSFTDFVKKIATQIFEPTLIAPSLTLTYSGTGFTANVESGFIGNLTLSSNFNRGRINGQRVNGFWDANSLQNYRAGVANNYTINGQDTDLASTLLISDYQIVDGSNTFTTTVEYGAGSQPLKSDGSNFSTPLSAGNISANVTMLGKRKTFYGTDSVSNSTYTTSNEIRSIANFVLGAIHGTTFTINIPIGAKKVTIAYDANLRDISTVKYVEGSNVEVKDIFVKTLVNVEGQNGYSAISYKVFTYIPVEPFTSTATYTVTI